jgi:peptidoglycan/LPS O-acetylase OafA/YrhL
VPQQAILESVSNIKPVATGPSPVARSAACLVYGEQFPGSVAARPFAKPFFRFFGRYSFGLYVFHGLFFVFIRHQLRTLQNHVHPSLLAQLLAFVFGFRLSIDLAMLSFAYFEEPLLRIKKRFA